MWMWMWMWIGVWGEDDRDDGDMLCENDEGVEGDERVDMNVCMRVTSEVRG